MSDTARETTLASEDGMLVPATRGAVPLWRRMFPLLLAAGLVAFVLGRVDWHVFANSLAEINYAVYLGAALACTLGLLVADTIATVVIYRWTIAPVRYRDFLILRGASYVPSLLNHHVGQAFLTYFLARAYGVELWRTAGATLVGYASWAGCILGFGAIALFAVGKWVWLLPVVLAAGLGYLVVVHLRPQFLANKQLLAPLFEVGVGGHLIALVARVPHFFVMFVGTWLPFWMFGVHIPFEAAAMHVPILMILVTLPLTPQGLGTRDAYAAAFFAPFAIGATLDERLAQVAAASLTWPVALTIVEVVIGLLLMRLALPRIRGTSTTRS